MDLKEQKTLESHLHYDSLEQQILGFVGVDSTLIPEFKRYLRPEMFENKKYGAIYEACLDMYADNQIPSEMTLVHWFRQKPKAGVEMMDVMDALKYPNGGAMDAINFAKSLVERWIKRGLGRLANEVSILSDREETDAFELLEKIQTEAEMVGEGTLIEKGAEDLSDLLGQASDYMDEASEGMETGVPTGLIELDDLTSGFQKGELIIIAGRPAMGKSALVTTIQKNSADAGYPSAMFSLEMSKYQCVCRLVSEDVQIPVSDLVKRRLSSGQRAYFRETVQSIKDLPISIDDNADMTIETLRIKARELKRKKGIELLIVDYLQLMSGNDATSREQEIAKISRGLKKIAKELEIPVVALAQLSRAVEQRDNKRPMMSDLRESGGIEQDADMILFLYRPEYYYHLLGEDCPENMQGKAQLIVGKYRNGSSDDIILKFVGEYSKFKDRDDLNRDMGEPRRR